MDALTLFPVPGMPLICPGDDVAQLIVDHVHAAGEKIRKGDIFVIAQKVISKAENRLIHLASVTPGEDAQRLAELVDKDPRIVQVILDDSREVIRARRGLLVVEQQDGWICANAGVDRSNVAAGNEQPDATVVLLPEDADASAARIRSRIEELTGIAPAVLINDSHGRAWRIGTVGVCIGCAGLAPLWDQRGLHDLFGYELVSSEECVADELAAAASLMMGQSAEGRPVVLIRGYLPPPTMATAPAKSIQRPAAMDAFR